MHAHRIELLGSDPIQELHPCGVDELIPEFLGGMSDQLANQLAAAVIKYATFRIIPRLRGTPR